MSTFIRCEALLVPASHYKSLDGERALQLHLSLDVTGPPDGQADEAWQRFKDFLDRAPTLEFRLCTIHANRPEPAILVRLGHEPQPEVDAVFNWIAGRTDRWQWDPAEEGGERVLSAGQLLGASAGWAPYAARNAGLAATLALPTGVAAAGMIILPYIAGFEPGDIEWLEEKGILYAVYKVSDVEESFQVEVSAIGEVPKGGNELLDPDTGLLFTAGGNAPDEDAHLVHEMLGTLGLRGASQLAAAHALLGISWPRYEAATIEEVATRDFGRLVFRGVSALASLFDPILLSLVMPGAVDEGPFIGAMITALDETLAGEAVPRALSEPAIDLTVVNLTLRIGEYLSLPDTGAAARKTFATRLKILLDLAPQPGEGKQETLWPELLRRFEEWEPGTAWTAADAFGKLQPAEIERRLDVDLGEILQWLESQDGSEAIAYKLIEEGLAVHAAGEISPGDKDLALKALGVRMKGDFNGADAARAAVGTLLVDALVAAARARDIFWSADELRAAIEDEASNWFVGRIWKDARAGSPFEAILATLPALGSAYLDPADVDAARLQLGAAWRDARRRLLGNSDLIRFEDSKVPLPLPVRINADADVKDGDIFAYNYAGLGVLIRRTGEDWAHANLATYASPILGGVEPGAGPKANLWVQPSAPAAVNGRRELFEEYRGFAFFEAELGPNPSGKPAREYDPYYEIDAPERPLLDAADLAALPALTYGITYELAAFAILRGGILPAQLAVEGEPWQPRPGPLMIEGTYIAKRVYSRTTMIGAVQLTGEGLQFSKDAGAGVQPLADDYPRKGFASMGEAAWFELRRNSDGSGAIRLPDDGDTIRVTLDDIAGWGGGGKLGVHLGNDPCALMPDPAAAMLTGLFPAAFAEGGLELIIGNKAGVLSYELRSRSGEIVIDKSLFEARAGEIGGDIDVPIFIQLSLVPDGTASLSFSDPAEASRGEADASASKESKVLLAAPSAEFVTPQGKPDVILRLEAPRVPYLDFERWLSNPALAASLIPEAGAAAKLLKLMLAAYLSGELADELPKFPDPAVRHLLVELTPLDGLADRPEGLAKRHSPARAIVALDNFSELGKAETLTELFDAIGAAFGATWTVKAHADFGIDKDARILFLPEGMTAELSVRPLVLHELFDKGPVLDPRLLQWAQGRLAFDTAAGRLDAYIFDGPRRVIEMMTNFSGALSNFAKPAFDFIGVSVVRTFGTDRGVN